MGKIFGKNLGKGSSLLRKFDFIFVITSFVPFLVLVYLFINIDFSAKTIKIEENSIFWLIILVAGGFLVGFLGMRRTVVSILSLSKNAKEIAGGDLSKRVGAKIKERDEIRELAAAFNEITRRLEESIEKLKTSRKTVQDVLYRITKGMASTQNVDSLLGLIVESTADALYAKTGTLMLIDKERDELFLKASCGLDKAQQERIKVGESEEGWVAKSGKPLLIPRMDKKGGSILCVPLTYQDRIIGTFSITGRAQEESFTEEELLLLSNIASQTAIAIENAHLTQDAERTYLETISALALAVEAKDPYSRGHSDRVAQYSVEIAREMGLKEETIRTIRDAAKLHDIGKIGISDDILRKPTSLTLQERQIVREHPVIGETIVRPLRSLRSLCDPIRHHHERLNGEGYPDGLKGEQISKVARILAVVDSYDAMTSDRPYRKAIDPDKARKELDRCVGIYYDGEVVRAFLKVVGSKERGSQKATEV